jgi:hypothetical protein
MAKSNLHNPEMEALQGAALESIHIEKLKKINLDNNNRFDFSGMYSLFKWVLRNVGV